MGFLLPFQSLLYDDGSTNGRDTFGNASRKLRSGSCVTFVNNARDASFFYVVAAQFTPKTVGVGETPVRAETIAKLKVAINGLKRIGRNFLRCWHGRNNSALDVASHLLKYDSMLGTFKADVKIVDNETISVDGKPVKVVSNRDPLQLPSAELGIDIVIKIGVFVDGPGAGKHIQAGAKKIIITAPAKGIVKGTMTTTHSYTGDQRLLDVSQRDLRRARAAALNIVPTSTDAAKAVSLVLPQLKGKLNGIALRVPTPNKGAEGPLKGVLDLCDVPLVSVDFRCSDVSSTIDSTLTMVMGDDMVKVVAWYDSEWGYSQREVDLAHLLASKWPGIPGAGQTQLMRNAKFTRKSSTYGRSSTTAATPPFPGPRSMAKAYSSGATHQITNGSSAFHEDIAYTGNDSILMDFQTKKVMLKGILTPEGLYRLTSPVHNDERTVSVVWPNHLIVLRFGTSV
ncbi:Glyceraldehyde-3-phosphate dehydrogenase B [Hibiscus syriacus]|uniref:Glyceraldehyde-3-phosphate dehydrogenase B n=1 Tax=Hibiscus syriacus TaxID=106335 RepID=A0A6A3DAC1_HIBSY|nr:Glyceraldehyde-3-phosphate dehydrogenase B [Hibiscus syriacus]